MRNIFWGLEPTGPIHMGYLKYLYSLFQDSKIEGNNILILLADELAILNKKDVEKVRYYTELLSNYFTKLFPNAKILKSSELLKDSSYWRDLKDLSFINFNQVTRGLPWDIRNIFNEEDGSSKVSFGQILYAMLQITDIKYLKLDKIYAGMDQTPVYALSKRINEKLKVKNPEIIQYPLLTLEGYTKTKDLKDKISASQSSGQALILDKSLYEVLELYFSGAELNDKQNYVLRKLKTLLPEIHKLNNQIEESNDKKEDLEFDILAKYLMEFLKPVKQYNLKFNPTN